MNRKFGSLLLTFALCFGLLAGCGASPEASPSATETASMETAGAETWSVFWYLCGTDLESEGGAATSNLAELTSLDLGEQVNFVIQTGGTSAWQNDIISSDSLCRYVMENNTLSLVDEQPLASMGDGATLGSFLSWGVETYPADHYMVVFWNHGGGSVSGVEFDELFENDSLTLTELADGLSMANTTFDVIGFDTCLMATLENASAIAPYGQYMVASEEYEPGGGWDYAAWPDYLSQNTDTSGLELGKAICDSYYEKCIQTETGDMATLSVIDLSAIAPLTSAFDAMAGEMTVATEDITSFQQLAQGAIKAENYGGNTDEEGYTNMVDLGDLVKKTETVLPETADSVLEQLDTAVCYHIKGASRAASNGLSVFFPLSASNEECDSYAAISPSTQYLRFLESVVESWSAPANSVEALPETNSVQSSDYEVQFETTITEDGYYQLDVTSGMEAVQTILFSLYYMDYDSNEYMQLGLDNDLSFDEESNTFYDNFRGVWPTLNGLYCAPQLIAEEENYNLYSIPIQLNGEDTNLRAAYIWDDEENGHFELYGVWNGLDEDTGMSAREIIQLQDGDTVAPLFHSYHFETGEDTVYTMGSFQVEGDVVLKESDLQDGDYMYQYEVTDVFGRTTHSDSIVMECKDGEISLYPMQ